MIAELFFDCLAQGNITDYSREAVEYVISNEGDKVVNDPADRGGVTRYGITKATYKKLDIQKLTKEQATEIYLRDFWEPHNFDRIVSRRIAIKLFDFAVNAGVQTAVKEAQGVLRRLGHDVQVTGILDPQTIENINTVSKDNFMKLFIHAQKRFYLSLTKKNKVYGKFLTGWRNRAERDIDEEDYDKTFYGYGIRGGFNCRIDSSVCVQHRSLSDVHLGTVGSLCGRGIGTYASLEKALCPVRTYRCWNILFSHRR